MLHLTYECHVEVVTTPLDESTIAKRQLQHPYAAFVKEPPQPYNILLTFLTITHTYTHSPFSLWLVRNTLGLLRV